jgi:hypothetical protein
VKFSSVVSIRIFSVKNANPSFYAKRAENGYFPLPSNFGMFTPSIHANLEHFFVISKAFMKVLFLFFHVTLFYVFFIIKHIIGV